MIEFTAQSYIIGLWYLELPVAKTEFGIGGNIMAAAWRDDDNSPWKIRLRIRMYRTLERTAAEMVKSSDKFTWSGWDAIATEDVVIGNLDDLFAKLAEQANDEPDWFEVRGGLDRMHAISAAGEGPHWFHMTSFPVEQVGRAGGRAR